MNSLQQARDHTIQGLSRISHFWGFPKGMGAIYGAVYLSPTPVSLDELVETVGISKGAVSTNVRQLERIGLVHKHIEIGERKDFYTAETDFWKVVKGILMEREKSEFDLAIRTVSESAEMISSDKDLSPEDAELASFYQKRLSNLSDFFKSLDNLVATLMALESLKSGVLERFGRKE
jgi:DNA-binding transcriptional regulator GbsR (MarR family)